MTTNPFKLTKSELKIFNEILRLKETSLGTVIRNIGLHKGTVYNSIRRLEEKGLISYKTKEGVNFYSIPSLALDAALHQEQEEHENFKKEVNKLIKIAESNQQKKYANVEVLVGEKSFKAWFSQLFEWASKNKKEYLFMGKGNEMIEILGENYYKLTQEKKKNLKIKCRAILSQQSKKLQVKNYIQAKVKYQEVENITPTSTWIYDDKIVIVTWGSKPILTIIITSENVNNSYKNFFETMWKTL